MYMGILGIVAFSILTTLFVVIANSVQLKAVNAFMLGVVGCFVAIAVTMYLFPHNASLLIYDDGEYDYLTLGVVLLMPIVMGYEVMKYTKPNRKDSSKSNYDH